MNINQTCPDILGMWEGTWLGSMVRSRSRESLDLVLGPHFHVCYRFRSRSRFNKTYTSKDP